MWPLILVGVITIIFAVVLVGVGERPRRFVRYEVCTCDDETPQTWPPSRPKPQRNIIHKESEGFVRCGDCHKPLLEREP